MRLPVQLQSDETLVVRKRRHPLFLAWQMGKVVLTGAAPIIVLLIVVNEISGLDGDNGAVAGIVSAVWGGSGWSPLTSPGTATTATSGW